MYNSDIAVHAKEMEYYLELSKFAKLGAWILNGLGADIDRLEDLIGEAPVLKSERKLTEEDLEIIEMAKELNLTYTITNNGVKIIS